MSDVSTIFNLEGQDNVSNVIGKIANSLGSLGISTAVLVAGAAVGLADLGEHFENAFNTISRGTGATGTVLNSLDNSFKSVLTTVPNSMTDVANAVTILYQKTGDTGSVLNNLATQLLNLSNLTGTDLTQNVTDVTNAFNRWQVPTSQQSALLNEMYKASQASGVSVATLSTDIDNMQPTLKAFGFNAETSTALVASLGKSGIDASSFIQGLNKELANLSKGTVDPTTALQEMSGQILSGASASADYAKAISYFGQTMGNQFMNSVEEGKETLTQFSAAVNADPVAQGKFTTAMKQFADSVADPQEALEVLIQQIQSAASPALASQIAIEDFGTKAGPKLAQAIQSGQFSITQMMTAMGDSKNAIDGTAASTETFAQKLQILKNQGMVALEPIAMDMIGWAGKLATALEDVFGWVQKNESWLVPLAQILGAVAAAVIVVNTVMDIYAAVTKAVTAVQAAFNLVMDSDPIILVAIAMAVLVVAIVVLWEKSSAFRDFFIDMGNGMLDVINAIVNSFKFWLTVAEVVFGEFENLFFGVETSFASAFNFVVGWGEKLVDWFAGLPTRIYATAIHMFDGIWDGFRTMINMVIHGWDSLHFTIGGGSFLGVSFPSFTLGLPQIPYLAEGGTIAQAGTVLVGEAGPEYLSLPQGAQVTPLTNGQGQGSSQNISVTFDVTGADSQMKQLLQKIVRINGGGNVQKALGFGS